MTGDANQDDNANNGADEWKAERDRLTATISTLETQIAELKARPDLSAELATLRDQLAAATGKLEKTESRLGRMRDRAAEKIRTERKSPKDAATPPRKEGGQPDDRESQPEKKPPEPKPRLRPRSAFL